MRSLPVLHRLDEVVQVVERHPDPVHVRFGSVDDGPSCDHLSGLRLPGLSVNPVTPPGWWRGRPLADWVARQLCAYAHLEASGDERRCLLLSGTEVDRGPDNEPLLAEPQYLAEIDRAVVEACVETQQRSPRSEDAPTTSGAPPGQATARDRPDG